MGMFVIENKISNFDIQLFNDYILEILEKIKLLW